MKDRLNNYYTPYQKDKVMELRNSNMEKFGKPKIKEIAAEVGLKYSAITSIIQNKHKNPDINDISINSCDIIPLHLQDLFLIYSSK